MSFWSLHTVYTVPSSPTFTTSNSDPWLVVLSTVLFFQVTPPSSDRATVSEALLVCAT